MTIELTTEGLSTIARPADALRLLAGGTIHLPDDPGYDAARMAWNLAVDQRPAAISTPRTPQEVGEVVRAAAAAGLRVAPQSTGHNAGPLASRGLDDVVILRTSELTEVSIDAERRICRVGGGAVWLPAVEAAAAHGLAALHGSSPDVGIAGYSLGGGLGWYARKLGLAANSLTAAEVVIADGTLVRADADTNAELFWALRGGGGNFGVVTALELALYPIETAYAGMMIWDLTKVEPVLRRWSRWATAAPEEVTTSFRVLHLPPLPELPEMIRGRSLAVIDGAVLGSDDFASSVIGPLRDLKPEIDTFARVPATALSRLHMDPEGGAPSAGDSAMLTSFSDSAVDAMLAEVGPGTSTSLMMAELRQLGGAVGRPHPSGGAVSHFDGQFLAFAGGMVMSPEHGMQVQADAMRLTGALAPYAGGRAYLNFVEDAADSAIGYDPETWRRLVGIRSSVDPDGIFVANHPIPRLYEDDRPTT